jgi:hypothetical protein
MQHKHDAVCKVGIGIAVCGKHFIIHVTRQSSAWPGLAAFIMPIEVAACKVGIGTGRRMQASKAGNNFSSRLPHDWPTAMLHSVKSIGDELITTSSTLQHRPGG